MAISFCGRLGNRQFLSALSKFPAVLNSAGYAQSSAATPKLTFKAYQAPELEHHRPMSPHLTIYSPQLTSLLSITHRITGMMLTGYFSVLGMGALVLPHDISHYVSMIEAMNLSPVTLFLAKFVLAAPVGYHLVNGVRHLYWDTGKGLTIKEVYSTGYAMLAASTIVTIALCCL